jgi:antitoxin (DNA-binding transcriptional repressor) of toxin-antitoxin stability system
MSIITVEAGEATIDELLAKVEAGDEVVIARGGHPVARLVGEAPATVTGSPKFGTARGRVVFHPGWEEPLGAAEAAEWYDRPVSSDDGG